MRRIIHQEEKPLIRRTLMHRNRELADFEVDPATGKAHVIDFVSDEGFAASLGLTRQEGDWVLSRLVERRAISSLRKDKDAVLSAFGAKSTVDLALRGHGLSLSDLFWYRVPGSTDRWEDINFFDNGWDSGFGLATLTGDYAALASCSPDVPETTTAGHAIKMWERNDDGILLVKAADFLEGAELAGAKLASEMCALLFGEGRYVPLDIVERCGKPCSVSPLMLGPDEELADGNRLHAMAGMSESPSLNGGNITTEKYSALIDAYAAIGVADASAHIARMACFSSVALLGDLNPGNYGAIRRIGSDEWRPAPIFDYDGSFGFPFRGTTIAFMSENPLLVELLCAQRFSFLDPSWDWSWYDPRALDGFEERILETYASYQSLPPGFAGLIARIFAMQREYVSKVAAGERA